jgi:AAA family ATP:ADP antiporter
MHEFRRLVTFFNIKPGEERLVGYLVLLSFVLELAFVLLQSMAFGVFIAEYGPQGLPYSYIVIAIFASLAAILYIKLGERVAFSAALMVNLASLGVFVFLVWLGLRTSFSHYISFILPLVFQIVLNLGSLVIWQLAGRLFNLQQAKRLFPLLNAGGWLANILGGLLVLPLVNWMGAINLLVPSTIMIGISMLILRTIVRTYPIQEASPSKPHRTAGRVKQSNGFLQNRYVLLIFAFIMIWWIAFFFLDNIFADRVAAQFPDVDQLTAFRGQLLSLTGVVAIITSTFLTSRIIGRFGLRAGLLGEALPVTFILGLLAISGSLGGGIVIMFALASLAKLVNVALGFSVSQSAYLMLYQPLPDTVRGRVQATAEGIFQPIASGLAGLSLLALTSGLKFNYLGLSYVYFGFAAGLLITIVLLSRGYVNAITQAITKRRLGESPTVVIDPASIKLLHRRLSDPHPGVVMYALTRLETLDPDSIPGVLPGLIQHPVPEVRREAFSRIELLSSAQHWIESANN